MLQFTVYRDGPWWVGVLEWEAGALRYAARQIFDAEPSNETILAFVLHGGWLALFDHRVVGVPSDQPARKPVNPKRRLRDVTRASAQQGISTQTREALDQSRALYRRERRETRD